MSKGRIILSTTQEDVTAHGNAASHRTLLTRQFTKFPANSVSHAIGMFEGKEELSLVIGIPDVPFILLASTAYNLALKFKQNSVYFSHNGLAYLATSKGEMVALGEECEGTVAAARVSPAGNHTRIIGTDYYIWTVK